MIPVFIFIKLSWQNIDEWNFIYNILFSYINAIFCTKNIDLNLKMLFVFKKFFFGKMKSCDCWVNYTVSIEHYLLEYKYCMQICILDISE